MSTARVYVFINGIMTAPGDAEGWTDRAVTWAHTRTPHKAEKFEYATGPLLRRFKQQSRAEKIATMLAYYERAGFEIALVGHSNGCDIIARVLALRGQQDWFFKSAVRSVHLFSAAADGVDFKAAIERKDVGRVHLYCAGSDKALALGRWSRRLFGWAGLGYGSLGLEPDNALSLAPGVFVHSEPAYGHSDWFIRGEFFEVTMQHLMKNDELREKPDAFVDEGEPGPGI